MSAFTLPDLGEGLDEAELVQWHVNVGDHVVVGQPMLSVETAKSIVEIPAPYSGQVLQCHAAPGDVIGVGEPVIDIDSGPGTDTGAIVGTWVDSVEPVVERPRVAVTDKPTSVRASPAARRLAMEKDLDLAMLEPSGAHGEVTVADVREHLSRLPRREGEEALRGTRRFMAKAMQRAGERVVLATVFDDAVVQGWIGTQDISVRLVRAVIAGVRAEPRLNAWLSDRADSAVIHSHIDLGVAVDTPDGLFVPVIRRAQSIKGDEIRSVLDTMMSRVRERTATPTDFQDPTITLSNFGSIFGRHAALVVLPPQVAIVGAGRVYETPIARAGSITAASVLPLSLTFDHRYVNGGEAARFLRAMVASLESDTGD